MPGYTTLVVDTNIFLSSLPLLAALVDSLRWTVIVPLPVVMELDGLASNANALGAAAKDALAFLLARVRSHAAALKVQTSRGNYLASLAVRTESVDFDGPGALERSMDDLILKAAIWQDEHWTDRSAFMGGAGAGSGEAQSTAGAAKVVLLSLDRNRQSISPRPPLRARRGACRAIRARTGRAQAVGSKTVPHRLPAHPPLARGPHGTRRALRTARIYVYILTSA